MATAVQPDALAKFAKMMDAYPGAGLREIIRLTPDSLLLGTGFLGLITQNYALGMLFTALFETAFITVGLQSLFGYISLKDNPPNPKAASRECMSGFQSPTLQSMSSFFKVAPQSSFPSAPVFILTTAVVYVITAMQGFSQELSELGPGYSTRYYIGIFLSLVILFIAASYRFLTGCDAFGTILLSLLFGFALGITLCWQNNALFGRDATNILGIPMFANTTADGKPLYICPTSS